MRLGFSLEQAQKQKQTQTLQLTQQMELSIRILQMDNIELDQYIGDLALENPVLELQDRLEDDAAALRQKKLEWLDQQARTDRQNTAYYDKDSDDRPYEVGTTHELNLADYLALQSRFIKSPSLREAVVRTVRYIDSNGYLRASDKELQQSAGELCPEMVVDAIHKMEPSGVGARTLAECLYLQLPPSATLERAIVRDHLETLAAGDLAAVAKALNVKESAVSEAYNRIRELDPTPGSAYDIDEPPVYIIPDILVVQTDEGELDVVPHRMGRFELHYNQQMMRLAKSTDDQEAIDYLNEKTKQAQWVEQSIRNRESTIMRVAREIIEHQREFFIDGPEKLRIFALGDVAEALELHESTISRAVRGKYLQCDHGVFALRSFFVQGVKTTTGEDASASAVQAIMRRIIDGEDKKQPYSDQQIAAILKGDGIQISRRTVAKYRGEMNIKASNRRSKA